MKIFSYVFPALSVAYATVAAKCERDISCLTKESQITMIGEVVSRDDVNEKKFSASVRPLCTMYGIGSSKILDEEYDRTIRISGFGTHSGGQCQGEIGIPGDIEIFFVHVNNTVPAGGVRTFGLTDPCFGAFANETSNFVELIKLTYGQNGYTPTGKNCPELYKDSVNNKIKINGNEYNLPVSLDNSGSNQSSLDVDDTDGSSKAYVMSTALIVFFALLVQLFF